MVYHLVPQEDSNIEIRNSKQYLNSNIKCSKHYVLDFGFLLFVPVSDFELLA